VEEEVLSAGRPRTRPARRKKEHLRGEGEDIGKKRRAELKEEMTASSE
jgi:ribosomal protein L19E